MVVRGPVARPSPPERADCDVVDVRFIWPRNGSTLIASGQAISHAARPSKDFRSLSIAVDWLIPYPNTARRKHAVTYKSRVAVVAGVLLALSVVDTREAHAVGSAVIYAADFGVKCDGNTDDTSNLRAAIVAAEQLTPASTGAILQLPSGFCIISADLPISRALAIYGTGSGVAAGFGNSGGTDIRSSCPTCNHFTVTSTNQFILRDIALDKSVTSTGGAGVNITQTGTNINRRSQFSNVAMMGLAYGYYFVNAANWNINDPYIIDFRIEGIYIASTSQSPDLGDSSIKGGTIWDLNYTQGDAGIRLDPAGGIEIVGVKLLGGAFGVRLTVSQGPTGTLNIGHNSFEQHNVSELYVQQATTGATYAFITVTGNQFQTSGISGYQNAITLANASSQYLSDVAIVGNVFRVCAALYGVVDVQSVNGAAITGNVIDRCGNTSVTPIILGQNALNVSVANNAAR